MLFDVGDADFKLEALVDFILLELAQLGVQPIDFSVELVNPAIESRFDCGEIVLGRHVLDDMRKHISEFVEGSLLCCHMRRVYHIRSVGAGKCRLPWGDMVGRRFCKIYAGAGAAFARDGKRQICKVVTVPGRGVEPWIGCWFCPTLITKLRGMPGAD